MIEAKYAYPCRQAVTKRSTSHVRLLHLHVRGQIAHMDEWQTEVESLHGAIGEVDQLESLPLANMCNGAGIYLLWLRRACAVVVGVSAVISVAKTDAFHQSQMVHSQKLCDVYVGSAGVRIDAI